MTKPVWQQRNFMLLWSGQLSSWLGTEVSSIATPLVVLALTGSPAQAGAVAGTRGLVYVFWAIPAGVIIDRLDRKRVMVVANLGSGLALASIAIMLALGRLTMAHLLIASAIEGSCFVFANLGRFAALPRVVSKEQFPAAAAQFGTADNVALLTGPPLGGFLYGAGGGPFAFAIDAATYWINAASIALIRTPLGGGEATERGAWRQEIAVGLVWLRRQPLLLFCNLVTAGRTLVTAGLSLLIIVIARDAAASSLTIGLVFTVGACGGLVSSLVAARIHRRLTLRQLLLGTTALSVAIFAAYAATSQVAILAAITACYYAVDTLYIVAVSSYSARITPDAIRGRIVSLSRLLTLGAHSLGFFLTGVGLQYIGPTRTIGIFVGLLLLLFLLTAANRRLGEG
jgi:MFS family permease